MLTIRKHFLYKVATNLFISYKLNILYIEYYFLLLAWKLSRKYLRNTKNRKKRNRFK